MSSLKVVGFGDNVVDRYTNQRVMFPGGNAVNFAVYAKRIGLDAAYLGVFGSDPMADHIQYALKDLGISLEHCVVKEGESGYCDVKLEDGDRVFQGWNEGGISTKEPMVLGEKELSYLGEFDFIHSGCYANTESELPKLRDLKGLVCFDFSDDGEFKEDVYLKKVCPYIDFALFSCEDFTEEQMKEFGRHVVELGAQYVLMTRGAKGQLFYDGREFYRGVVHMVEAVDTMGAGDSFMTAFTMSLLQKGWTKKKAPTEEEIKTSFEAAAGFSADNCLQEGSFGYRKRY